MNDKGPAFVDTNVLVYAYDEVEDLRRETAQHLLKELTSADRLRLSFADPRGNSRRGLLRLSLFSALKLTEKVSNQSICQVR